MAYFSRVKRLPSLKSLLREEAKPLLPQSPEQVADGLRDWAAELGLKVERHEKPVI